MREKAKRELGEWFVNGIKEDVRYWYKYWRKEGMRAFWALEFARSIVEFRANQMMEANFYAGLPH